LDNTATQTWGGVASMHGSTLIMRNCNLLRNFARGHVYNDRTACHVFSVAGTAYGRVVLHNVKISEPPNGMNSGTSANSGYLIYIPGGSPTTIRSKCTMWR
jgi:hypothetical protein